MLKILTICDVLFPQTTGGAGRLARELSEALLRRGVEMEFLTRQPDHSITITGNIPTTYYPKPGINLPSALRRLFRERLRSFNPDIVHIHQPLPAYFAISGTFPKPVVYTFHSPWPEELKLKNSRWPKLIRRAGVPFFRHIEKEMVRRASQIVVLSETSRRDVMALYGRGDAQVIPGGVDTVRFRPLDQPDRINTVQLITLRNLVPRMGLPELIRAMATLPEEVRLNIGGDGSLRDDLQQLIRSLKLESRIRLRGRIPDADLPSFYSSADWFVLPTAALEGFGLVILESLACGTPVLGTRVGAIPELLNRFDPAWIISEPNAGAIAHSIRQAIQMKRPDRSALHDLVARDFGWDVIAFRYLELFQKIR